MLIFKQSVRGLEPGAPVEIGGVPIGEVTTVQAQFDLQTLEFTVPVTISVDPTRFGVEFLNLPAGEDAETSHRRVMDGLVAHGLRAQLRKGNLLSGALYVAVEFFPKEPPLALDWSQSPVQLPTVPGQIEALEVSLNNILKKVDQLQLKEIGDELKNTIVDLDKTLVGARGTLTNTDKLLESATQLIAPDSALDVELNRMLHEGGDAARALRVLADYLERHPEALIHGKNGKAK
jgi:paraquat-inducible protein B